MFLTTDRAFSELTDTSPTHVAPQELLSSTMPVWSTFSWRRTNN